MTPHMVFLAPHHSASQVRQLRISLPLIEALIDGVRYFRPDDLPPPAGDDLRPWLRPRITRGPSMRTIVRSAVANELAEETAKKWRRFDRSLVRQGTPGRRGSAGYAVAPATPIAPR